MECSDDFVGVHLEHDFQIGQVREAPPGGSTERLDWATRPGLHQGARPWSSIGVLVLKRIVRSTSGEPGDHGFPRSSSTVSWARKTYLNQVRLRTGDQIQRTRM